MIVNVGIIQRTKPASFEPNKAFDEKKKETTAQNFSPTWINLIVDMRQIPKGLADKIRLDFLK